MKIAVDKYQIVTQSGEIIDFSQVDPKRINRFDLAKGLAHVCRYSGQVSRFYSVAEHCVLVARHAPLALKPYALLHDAAEAYIGDVPRPVKLLCPEYKGIEAAVEEAILDRFRIEPIHPWEKSVIKGLDQRALLLEASELKVGEIQQWLDVPGEPLDDEVQCWTPEEAERQWLYAAELLGVL